MTFNEIIEYLLDKIAHAKGAGAYKEIGLWNSYAERHITVETMSRVSFEDYKNIATVSNLQEFLDCVFKNNLGGKTMVTQSVILQALKILHFIKKQLLVEHGG